MPIQIPTEISIRYRATEIKIYLDIFLYQRNAHPQNEALYLSRRLFYALKAHTNPNRSAHIIRSVI